MTTSGANAGAFTYNPPAGYTGTDTFTYTITNTAGSSTATVSIVVSNTIWFINNAASAGDGRFNTPFNSLAAFQAVNDGVGNHPKGWQRHLHLPGQRQLHRTADPFEQSACYRAGGLLNSTTLALLRAPTLR